MTPEEAVQRVPHLLSPAHLAIEDSGGKWKPVPHLRAINNALVRAWSKPNSRLAINVPFQHGKLIAHDTPVLTENGWKTHGELQIDDYVFSPSGLPVRVENLSSDSQADYEIIFSDGSIICCHARHEWLVYDRTGGRKWRVLETREIESRPLRDKTRYNFSVPRVLPLVTPLANLIVEPYVLGAWLGDGHSNRGELSHSSDDWEVILEVEKYGYSCAAKWVQKDTGVCYARFDKLKEHLNKLKVLGNKHIPQDYLLSSREQRLELLAGLIDTDGSYSSQSSQYRFTNTNKVLFDQVAFIARSLGFKVGIQSYLPIVSSSGIEGKQTVYVLAFSPTSSIPCRIPRKQTKKLAEPCRLSIANIRRCEPRPGRCIQVEGGLYLVGESLIPTHNSVIGSTYFPAWVLLRWPETRIGLASYSDGFAANFGGKVKDVVEKFGPDVGVHLREDTSAKGEWVIDKHGGGMVCKGRGGSFIGRPVDLLILDDLIKDAEEAQSPTILQGIWDWYCTVAYSRLGPKAPVIGIGTRWGPKDIFGMWEQEAKVGGDKFETINFTAIAEENDILGRKPGEPLWQERVPLERLQRVAQLRPRWFRACWQGKPMEGEGINFQPRTWPKYVDVGDAWRVQVGLTWNHYRKVDSTILVAVDWAQSGKKQSNKTAIVVGALTDDGKILVLHVMNKHLRYEENAPSLEVICKTYSRYDTLDLYMIVASDDDMLSDAMVVECRRYRSIPEIKRMGIRSRAKIMRAQAGIIRSQNGLFLVPEPKAVWFEEMADQLSAFTGEEGEEDDIADCFGILGRLADEFKPGEDQEGYEALLGALGYSGEIY